jgi:hypothetical protein
MYQSWSVRNSERSKLSDSSMYSYTQPTPVASGPRVGSTPVGNCWRIPFRYSSTRERAQ